jgi:hypothetical protein
MAPAPPRPVAIFDRDSATGVLRFDERFGSMDDSVPGGSFDREEWPELSSGPATPHAALFGHR